MENKSDPINVIGVNPLKTASDNYLFQVISHVYVSYGDERLKDRDVEECNRRVS
jgi:hypothetical protein